MRSSPKVAIHVHNDRTGDTRPPLYRFGQWCRSITAVDVKSWKGSAENSVDIRFSGAQCYGVLFVCYPTNRQTRSWGCWTPPAFSCASSTGLARDPWLCADAMVLYLHAVALLNAAAAPLKSIVAKPGEKWFKNLVHPSL